MQALPPAPIGAGARAIAPAPIGAGARAIAPAPIGAGAGEGSDRKTKLSLLKSKNESDQIERKNFMESLILAQDERWRYA